MSKRIEWIDVIKFVCMFCVITTHLECHTEVLFNIYYSFYLAGFFFCSGYCYLPVPTIKELLIKKAKQLLLPWFIYSNANILISQIVSIKEHKDIKTELLHNLLQVRNYDERLWFLVSLFVTFIPFFYLVKIIEKNNKNTKKVLIVTIMLFFIKKLYSYYMPYNLFVWGTNKLPWHIDYFPTAMLSMIIGYCFKIKYEPKFDKFNTKRNRLFFSFFYLLLMSINYFNKTNSFAFYSLYDFVGHISGLIFIVLWCKTIQSNKLISFVGRNTLVYFCIHNKFATVIEYAFKKMLSNQYSVITSNFAMSALLSLSLTIITIVILIPVVYFINNYLFFTLGKNKRIT